LRSAGNLATKQTTTMYTGLQYAHSGLAYLLLAALVFAIVYNLIGFMGNKPFTEGNRKIALIGLISAHIQLLIGLVLYFISPLGMSNFSGANMKDATARLYMLEHPLTMIIAIVLITIGYSKAKKLQDSRERYKKVLIFFTLGLILILSRIPWSAWL
jgi:NADH:ubiquinone oxidoreductase subunit 2 (subunit N)